MRASTGGGMAKGFRSKGCLALARALGRCGVLVICASPVFEAIAAETWVSAGVGGSDETLYTYIGATLAPMGTLDQAGLRGRLWGKGLRFNDGVEGANTSSVVAEIHGYGMDAELGWQFVGPEWRAALYAGGVWRVEAARKERFGASLGADINLRLSERWRVLAGGKHTFGLKETWVHMKPEFRFGDSLSAGLVASANKGQGYSLVRGAGSLSGLRVQLPWVGKTFISLEVGLEYNVTTKNSSPFGGLHMGFAY